MPGKLRAHAGFGRWAGDHGAVFVYCDWRLRVCVEINQIYILINCIQMEMIFYFLVPWPARSRPRPGLAWSGVRFI